MPINSQLGVKTESAYGTAVIVDRFYQFETFDMTPEVERLEDNGLRSSGYVTRQADSVPTVLGYSGSASMKWRAAGMGWWLTHMLGGLATTGPADTSAYTHTGTLGALNGKSFTAQANNKLHPAGTSQALTYEGCKITGWTLELGVNGLLMISFDLVAEDLATGTSLATASYASNDYPLSWAGAAMTVDSSAVKVESFKITCSQGLNTSRHKLQSSARRQEPTENDRREITFEFVADFESIDQLNRVKSETAADLFEEVELTVTGPTLIPSAASTYPSLTATLSAARFDSISGYGLNGTSELKQTISGKVCDNGSDEPITLAYVSADSTA